MTSVAVDADDRVYVFNRGNLPVLVFDPDGNLVDRWGNDDPAVTNDGPKLMRPLLSA